MKSRSLRSIGRRALLAGAALTIIPVAAAGSAYPLDDYRSASCLAGPADLGVFQPAAGAKGKSALPAAKVSVASEANLTPLDLSIGKDATEDVRRTIDLLFDGMREGDASKVRSAFADAAVMGRPRSESGVTTFEFRSVDEFAVAVGRPHEKIWDERIGAVEIRVDGHLASAWMEYAFYLGDDLHHCGVNSMQLVRFGPSWKIVALLDTDRGLACSEELDS